MDLFYEELKKISFSWSDFSDLKKLMDLLKEKRVIFLGECSHGTAEFYHLRKLITLELVKNHDFNLIALEGDWPGCRRLHDLVNSSSSVPEAMSILKEFDRWPTWIWANLEMEDFLFELKLLRMEKDKEIGLFGLDLYSLTESVFELKKLLQGRGDEMEKVSSDLYQFFEKLNFSEKKYANSLVHPANHSGPYQSEKEMIERLFYLAFLENLSPWRLQDSREFILNVSQNVRIIKNAINFFQSMIQSDNQLWNIREKHMFDTICDLLDHHGPDSKMIIWAHNDHVGDSRGQEKDLQSQLGLGGLMRKKISSSEIALIGLGTFKGSVFASKAWEGEGKVIDLPGTRTDSMESLLHRLAEERNAQDLFVLFSHVSPHSVLNQFKNHRSIGVIYHPESERSSNYSTICFPRRYDGFIFVNETHALSPFKTSPDHHKLPDSYPLGVR